MKIKTLLLALTIVLTGCSAQPTRDNNPDHFILLAQGRINSEDNSLFIDCLLNEFASSYSVLSNRETKQQWRSDVRRVEVYIAGNSLSISADVFNDGRVKLFESKNSALINTRGQRTAFNKCIDKFNGTIEKP